MSNRPPDDASQITLGAPDGMPTRADVVVRRELPFLSRRQVRELFSEGRVRINGQRARKGSNVGGADRLTVELSERETSDRPLPDTALTIDVLFEDSQLIALDKPAGVPTLPLRVGERGTVANFLAARYPDSPLAGGAFECGLVHRLDTGTSGVILAARTMGAYRHLRDQFRKRQVGKSYLALVHGDLAVSHRVEAPIAHAAHNTQRMEVHFTSRGAARSRARPAVTMLRPVKRFGDVTLVAVRIRTGVRHQVRVHLASVRHPIVGDELYASAVGAAANVDVPRASRPLLHARSLRFRHPADGRLVRIVAPIPTDLQTVLTRSEASGS